MSIFGKFSLVAAMVTLAVVCASAQAGNENKAVLVPLPPDLNCPVGVQAQHSSGLTAKVPVGKNGDVIAKPKGEMDQHLQLMLSNLKGTAISSIRITVHGWSGKGQTMPATGVDSSYATGSQTVELKANVEPHATAKEDLWVNGLTSVSSIDLDEVNYADGLSWRSSAAEACRIVPDPEMLISSR
jgi:hypothetical protein